MGRKKLPPWGKIGDGKPIERIKLGSGVPQFEKWADEEAKAEQFRRMRRVKEYYGIREEKGWRPWYDLAVALASERDPALTVVDAKPPRTDRTAPRMRGPEGVMLVEQIQCMREDYEALGVKQKLIALLAEHQQECSRYRHIPLKDLERMYYRALEYYDTTDKRKPK
ncbi:MAG TPA: hypothetical protein VNK52_04685 [Hyphomicrobiaceae bacterium]|nr:hypothetical protein [Hyphomicrobiaceae bacterium]